jgi:hypothetical protein
MDDIQAVNINCITTECGHQFHASCLLKNAAHNGFACPYCRSTLAEEPEEEEDDDDELSQISEEENELYDDHALRGMRWLFQQANSEPLDEEEDEDEEDQEAVEEQVPAPTAAYLTQKLAAQGITMEDLVKCMLYMNHEEYEEYESYEVKENEMFGKFRILISNFRPEEVVPSHPPANSVDVDAQPKARSRRETILGSLVVDDVVM